MFDFRPVANLIGLLVAALGLTMLVPAGAAIVYGDGEADTFVLCAFLCFVAGAGMALTT